MIENNSENKTAVLVGVQTQEISDERFETGMEELAGLAQALGIEVLYAVTQSLAIMNQATCVGSGKLNELKRYLVEDEPDLVIFNNTLSPSQLRNLSNELQTEVLDRTNVILNIFAERARTKEAMLQVQYAKLKYTLPRLVGLRSNLSRQGGTGGSMSNKGAGEKQIELDRRKIVDEMAMLRRSLKDLEKNRSLQRKRRENTGIPKVALVGYTNAGKSTLLNRILSEYGEEPEKSVLVKDMLFATLDTTTRKIVPENGRAFLLSDTVGFIDDLPTDLVEAFRSTLEEVAYADLIIQVVDSADPNEKMHREVTKKTLEELGAGNIPRLLVMNKADKIEAFVDADATGKLPQVRADRIYMSASNGIGISELLNMISEQFRSDDIQAEFLIPYQFTSILQEMRRTCEITKEEYVQNGIEVCASMPQALYQKIMRKIGYESIDS